MKISTRFLAFIFILIATAIPSGFRGARFSREFVWVDAVNNLLLYIPFGLAFDGDSAGSVLLGSGALSAGVEAAQLFFRDRFSQASDVVANVAGGLLGFALGRILRIPREIRLNWRLSLAGWTGLAAWIVVAPVLNPEFRPLIPGAAPFVRGLASVPCVAAMATTGFPANAAFVAFLASLALAVFRIPKQRLWNIGITLIAGISGAVLLIPRQPALRLWGLPAGLAVSAAFAMACRPIPPPLNPEALPQKSL